MSKRSKTRKEVIIEMKEVDEVNENVEMEEVGDASVVELNPPQLAMTGSLEIKRESTTLFNKAVSSKAYALSRDGKTLIIPEGNEAMAIRGIESLSAIGDKSSITKAWYVWKLALSGMIRHSFGMTTKKFIKEYFGLSGGTVDVYCMIGKYLFDQNNPIPKYEELMDYKIGQLQELSKFFSHAASESDLAERESMMLNAIKSGEITEESTTKEIRKIVESYLKFGDRQESEKNYDYESKDGEGKRDTSTEGNSESDIIESDDTAKIHNLELNNRAIRSNINGILEYFSLKDDGGYGLIEAYPDRNELEQRIYNKLMTILEILNGNQ